MTKNISFMRRLINAIGPWDDPRIWIGMPIRGKILLLAKNGFDIKLPYLFPVVRDLFIGFINSILGLLQKLIYGRSISKSTLRYPPLFILGHWRCGTTFLQQVLSVDPRHVTPTYYQCLAPKHFRLTEKIFTPIVKFLLPKKRPPDDVEIGANKPFEDEYALCNLGLPSPLWSLIFPNRPFQNKAFLNMESVPTKERNRWKKALLYFFKAVSLGRGQRIVLKSPEHSFRIKILLEMFPEARFLHIVRNPYEVYPSTINLMRTLLPIISYQKPNFIDIKKNVFNIYKDLYKTLEETRGLPGPNQFYEIKYEDLMEDPVGKLKAIYDYLQLGDFEIARPNIEVFLEAQREYKTNKFELTSEEIKEINQHWGPFIRKYHYPIIESSTNTGQDPRLGK